MNMNQINTQVTETLIHEQVNRAVAAVDDGESRYPGLSYEEGVRDALDWVIYGGDKPLPDDDFQDEED